MGNGGNPFFVEEMLRFLVENHAVRWVRDHWEVLDATRVGIPESVKLLVQERVGRLGEEAVAVLQQAAVLGEEFSFAALLHVAGRTEEQLVRILDQAMSAGLLVLQRRVMRKHAQVFFFSYGPFIMGDSHSFVASFKIRPRVTL